MIKTVIFDMDGVLIDTETICARAWQKSAELNQIQDIKTAIVSCIGLNETDTKAYFMSKYGETMPYQQFKEDSSRIFYEIADREGVAVKTGVYELMHYLKQQGFRIGLASSSREYSVRLHMGKAKLTDNFEILMTGDKVVHSKPDPEIYLKACEAIGAEPEETIAIEDSFNGIRSAYRAGMKVIMVPDMVKPTEEIRTMLYGCFETLLDVKTFLEEMD